MTVAATMLAPLATTVIEPDAPVEDLEPLRGLIGDAKVVAIGESAHYVPEFHLARHRLLRFLVERMGFATYALEAPFTAGRAIDRWIASGIGEISAIADAAMPIRLGRIRQLPETLRWMRASRRVRFVGTDVPGSGGSVLPVLEEVRDVLRSFDPDALPLVDRGIDLARSHDHAATFVVLARYAGTPPAEQDELSAILSRLLARLDTTSRQLDQASGTARDIVLALRGAWYADHLHRDVAGRGLPAAAASRDAFMAEVVLDRLRRAPRERIVVASHNVHIQKVPAASSRAGQIPQGAYLAAALGDDYRAIALTAAGGTTAEIRPNVEARDGFEIVEIELERATNDSLDVRLAGNAPLAIADLRGERDSDVRRMRMEGYFLELSVVDAFDAVAWVPRSGVSGAVFEPR
jgi:erythromycin esterase